MKILFLHGVGDGNVKDAWFRALCDSLDKLGYQRPDVDDVIAPDYAAVLTDKNPPACQLLPITTPSLGEEEVSRLEREYTRRLGALERLLADTETPADSVGLPGALVQVALELPNFKQARNYVNNDNLRCRVLRTVLRELHVSGDLVIVGHSLGSLIAIDLLDHLPGGITVQRLVTIGSPAGQGALHGKTNRLVRTFPISRVKSWANLWSVRDPVCYGRGIAHHFPHALDLRIDMGICEHGAEAYLRNEKVGTAIGEAVFGSLAREVAQVQTAADVPLDVQEMFAITAIVYAHHLSEQFEGETRRRFRAAFAEIQQTLIDCVFERCQSEERPVPAQFREIVCELAEFRRKQHRLLDDRQAIPVMLALLSGNVVAPYEIKTEREQQERALKEVAFFLGFPRVVAEDVCQTLEEAREIIKKIVKEITEDGRGWAAWALAAAGVGLFMLGPVGLMMAAPAGLYGGAAIVAALAAFGPGGMVGGLAMMGGLMAAGGGMAAAAVANALVSAPEAVVEHALAQLLARALVLQRRKLPRDDRVWFVLCELESQIARELQRLRPISDKDAPSVKALERKEKIVRRVIDYLIEHGLGPPLLTDQTS